jgi:hypothetical protein
MSQRQALAIGCLFMIVALLPRNSYAGIIDLIWEMSGPQMIGGLVECRFALQGDLDQCTVVGIETAGPSVAPPRRWIALAGGLYVSTGKNADGTEYEGGDAFMLAFEPMFEFITAARENVAMYHGVGATVNFLTGSDFKRFFNGGLKLRPVGFILGGRVNVSYTLRVYPRGFTPAKFGKPATSADDDGAEAAHGFSFGVRF